MAVSPSIGPLGNLYFELFLSFASLSPKSYGSLPCFPFGAAPLACFFKRVFPPPLSRCNGDPPAPTSGSVFSDFVPPSLLARGVLAWSSLFIFNPRLLVLAAENLLEGWASLILPLFFSPERFSFGILIGSLRSPVSYFRSS